MTLPASDSAANWGVPHADSTPIEDPTTDISAAQFDEMAADVAMMTHTARQAWCAFTAATYTSGTQSLTVSDHDALWGSDTGVKPTVGQTSAGAILITWTATQVDELGVTQTIAVRVPQVWSAGAADGNAKVVSWTANTITIQLSDTSWAANALNGNTIFVAF